MQDRRKKQVAGDMLVLTGGKQGIRTRMKHRASNDVAEGGKRDCYLTHHTSKANRQGMHTVLPLRYTGRSLVLPAACCTSTTDRLLTCSGLLELVLLPFHRRLDTVSVKEK